jgi:hypothetical protein
MDRPVSKIDVILLNLNRNVRCIPLNFSLLRPLWAVVPHPEEACPNG